MSLYGDYILEHHGDGIVEREEGFATYRILNAGKSIYIVDIYTRPDFRKTSIAAEMADQIVEIGKKQGCNELLGTVVPSAKRSTDSLKVLLAYGMKVKSSSDNLIVFNKEI